ncbi:MAG: hypothetical protein K1000chlam3_01525 [Chlamydiae bacterium]|nr:hypothetical protein [Chlamydiota bacterium]
MISVEVVPYGILTTRTKDEYYLLAPEPVESEDWMHSEQQKFLVIPFTEGVTDVLYKKHYLITTDPDIHLFPDASRKIRIYVGDKNEKTV